MNILRNPQAGAVSHARAAEGPAASALPGSFVVNLCALAAPLAVPQPRAPELKEFRFFVSRRVTNAGERFFLHMGFFATLREAEKWASAVRSTYPNACVSRVAGTPGVSQPDTPALSETETVRVLEARAPNREAECGDTRTDTGSYSVRSEERVHGTPPQSPAVARPTPIPAPQTKSDNRLGGSQRRGASGIADELEALAASEFEMADHSDSLSATGVRHLRVEVERKSRRSVKSSGARKP